MMCLQRLQKFVHQINGNVVRWWHGLSDAKKEGKVSNAKRTLNCADAGLMTKEKFDRVDSQGEVLGWFGVMRTLVDAFDGH